MAAKWRSPGRVIAALSGQENILVLRVPYLRWTGDIYAALMLDKALALGVSSQADEAGWFERLDVEWCADFYCTKGEVARARTRLLALSLMEASRRGMPRRMHYRAPADKVHKLFAEWLAAGSPVTRNRITSDAKSNHMSAEIESHSFKEGVKGLKDWGTSTADGLAAPAAPDAPAQGPGPEYWPDSTDTTALAPSVAVDEHPAGASEAALPPTTPSPWQPFYEDAAEALTGDRDGWRKKKGDGPLAVFGHLAARAGKLCGTDVETCRAWLAKWVASEEFRYRLKALDEAANQFGAWFKAQPASKVALPAANPRSMLSPGQVIKAPWGASFAVVGTWELDDYNRLRHAADLWEDPLAGYGDLAVARSTIRTLVREGKLQ